MLSMKQIIWKTGWLHLRFGQRQSSMVKCGPQTLHTSLYNPRNTLTSSCNWAKLYTCSLSFLYVKWERWDSSYKQPLLSQMETPWASFSPPVCSSLAPLKWPDRKGRDITMCSICLAHLSHSGLIRGKKMAVPLFLKGNKTSSSGQTLLGWSQQARTSSRGEMNSLICFHTACITCASVCPHFSLNSDKNFIYLNIYI